MYMEPAFGNLAADIPLTSVLMLVFYGVSALYILFSAIMYYHWNEYSIDASVTRLTTIAYLITTVPLMATIGIIALTF